MSFLRHSPYSKPIQRWRPLAATTKEVPRPYGRGTSFVVSFVLALNRVNVVAVTTILVLHVGVIGHHVPCHYDFMFPRRSYHARLRARGVRGALPPGRGVWGGLRPPQGSRGVWGPARPPMIGRIPIYFRKVSKKENPSPIYFDLSPRK